MAKSRMPLILVLLLTVLLPPAFAKPKWKRLLRETGEVDKQTGAVQVDAPKWRVIYRIVRDKDAGYATFRLQVREQGTAKIVRHVYIPNSRIPQRLQEAEDAWSAFKRGAGSGRDPLMREGILHGEGPGAYSLQVQSRGVSWEVRLEELHEAEAPAAAEAWGSQDSGGAPKPLLDEDERQAAALHSAWSKVQTFSSKNAARQKPFTIDALDWRIRYTVRPKGARPRPVFSMMLKNVETGKVRTFAPVDASALAALAAAKGNQGGSVYLHEAGKFRLLARAVNVDWSVAMEIPAQAGLPASEAETAPGEDAGGAETNDGWDEEGGADAGGGAWDDWD